MASRLCVGLSDGLVSECSDGGICIQRLFPFFSLFFPFFPCVFGLFVSRNILTLVFAFCLLLAWLR